MIKIDGNEYRIGMNLHVRLLYERMSGKLFGVNMLMLDHIILFFAALTSFNKETFKFSFDEFVDKLDACPELLKELMDWEVNYFRSQIPQEEGKAEDEGKKKD